MIRLPVVGGQEVIKALKRAGFIFDRQRGPSLIQGKVQGVGYLKAHA